MKQTIEKKQDQVESFESLLNETPFASVDLVGKVVKGVVVDIIGDSAIVDVGLKSEGRVFLKEFSYGEKGATIQKMDEVDVYVERMEDKDGMIVLSHDKARREASWIDLERASKAGEPVTGILFGRVKGGFTVDLKGAIAFLPGSQLDVRPIKDVDALMNIEQPFLILKMDRARGNIVVSRRAILEESRTGLRDEVLSKIEEGITLEGIVKNITDYGAFVDLGGVDGLLHITDMSWSRLNHPSELISLGQTINVQVVRYNRDTGRISLGMKQLESDPWQNIQNRYKVGDKVQGKVTNIADYGAFIEIEPGIEGLIHVSEMSWTKKNIHPSKLLSTSQGIEAAILEIDSTKRRIALGLKQCSTNPWENVLSTYKAGAELEGTIRNITEFGLFISVTDDIDGMVHMSDLSWEKGPDAAIKDYKVGQSVKVKILEIDADKERISLGIKQLTKDPFTAATSSINKNDIVTCEITRITDGGVEVSVGALTGFIRKGDLARDRSEQRPDRFAVGEKVDAKVLTVDKKARSLSLSIKAREISEEKEAMATYGSADSGASLGDILGAALSKAKVQAQEKETKKPAAPKAEAKKPAKKAPVPKVEKPEKPAAKKAAAPKAAPKAKAPAKPKAAPKKK
jgi:small subunit ribosomal protein S1